MFENEYEASLGIIADRIDEFLQPLGFTKRDKTFNAWTADGLCNVFNLQPGIKSLEGQFTANLGIFVPAIFKDTSDKEIPSFIPEPYCHFRARFCNFNDTDDEWWDITDSPDLVISEIIDLLQIYGLPFFIKFPDRQSIIEHMLSFDEKYEVSLNIKLEMALILESLGRHEEAEKMFNQHYLASTNNELHIKHLEKVALKHNWSTLNHK